MKFQAIFDSAYSGNMLGMYAVSRSSDLAETIADLVHCACNNVYVPWVNQGYREDNIKPSSASDIHVLPHVH